jgi:hypothetical protein
MGKLLPKNCDRQGKRAIEIHTAQSNGSNLLLATQPDEERPIWKFGFSSVENLTLLWSTSLSNYQQKTRFLWQR